MKNTISDELWTIAVALGCHGDTDPKAVMNRVLQAICDYQMIRLTILSADGVRKFSGYGSEQCKRAFDEAIRIARAHPSHQETA